MKRARRSRFNSIGDAVMSQGRLAADSLFSMLSAEKLLTGWSQEGGGRSSGCGSVRIIMPPPAKLHRTPWGERFR